MEIAITKKYLVFPVNTNAKNKYLRFSVDHKPVYELNIKLDLYSPNFHAYIDVSRFSGQTLDLTVEPEMEIPCEQADDMELAGLYQEPLRPQVHFTAKNGWINDPNGLIYLDGVYHLFYQYNPAGNNWDNMHWGHAVSADLIHWEEQDVAMFVGENGNIFSGSAIVDKEHLLGLANGENPAVLLYYTATGPPFSQRMAYSSDHFRTIHEYGGNPVVPHMVGANRDPKVVFCEELDAYVMALFLIDNEYALLSSRNLTEWKVFQKIQLPNEAECPDFFSIRDKKGKRRWILMGASDNYLVGEFKNGAFVSTQQILPLQYGSGAYAGQTFSNMPGDRVVRVCWDRWDHPSTSFTGQMGIPMELTLEENGETFYLCAAPVKELENLVLRRDSYDSLTVSANRKRCIPLDDKPYFVKLRGDYAEDVVLNFILFGCDFKIDFSKNQLALGGTTMPVSIRKENLDLVLIADRHSIEIFTDGGKAYMMNAEECGLCDRNLPWLTVASNADYCVKSVTLCPLNPIWDKQEAGS